eukprot:5104783-Prymnesium_polylepis.1
MGRTPQSSYTIAHPGAKATMLKADSRAESRHGSQPTQALQYTRHTTAHTGRRGDAARRTRESSRSACVEHIYTKASEAMDRFEATGPHTTQASTAPHFRREQHDSETTRGGQDR